ncbi:MAG TPA: CHASE domain-containing protein [Elusimicrobiota bacterium]|nr:CHASE domain-containing protein [Elusimicrobiota bacterium]HMX42944.1 CHASE domain-containing protein [Elusimicrobiota bacterium]HMZ27437.1 CHASE domain-containing protein [Elusimicrobiota bacterium]HNA60515.1 CHASE domain-containing protein [Elusimicrobiota bacterium]HNC74530.1 CHASE domain-containing protein [Elusimicrobiota bacterium]
MKKPAGPLLRSLGALWIAACLVAMALTVRYMKGAVRNAFVLRSAGVSQLAQANLQEFLDRHTRDLGDLAQNLGEAPPNGQRDFEDRAARVLPENPAFAALNFFNRDFILTWGFPYAANRTAEGLNLKTHFAGLAAARRAIERHGPAASGLVDLLQGESGVLLYAPVFEGDTWRGLIEGALQIPRLAARFIAPLFGPRFRFMIIDERRGEELYSNMREVDHARTPAYDAYFTLNVADRIWWVVLHPVSPPPTLALVVGALMVELAVGAGVLILAGRRKWD